MNKIFGLIVILVVVGDLEFCKSLPYENQNETNPAENANPTVLIENVTANLSLQNNTNKQNEKSLPTIMEPSSKETLRTDIDRNNETSPTSITLPTTKSTGMNDDDDYDHKSEEIVTIPEKKSKNEESKESNNEEVANTQTKSHKSVVELLATHTYNNSFVLTNLLNFSRNKYDISPIGEPVNLTGFIENLVFEQNPHAGFLTHPYKRIIFSNIHASGISSSDSFYMQDEDVGSTFTCVDQHCRISVNVIPENMTFEGDYEVIDMRTNKTCIGTFVIENIGAYLSYDIPNISILLHDEQNLKNNGEINFNKAKMIFTPQCENQCLLLTFSMQWVNYDVKTKISENLDVSFILKSINQIISAFPFLHFASPSTQSLNYFVIEETVVLEIDTSDSLQLGPMMIKGLDNFYSGFMQATKGHRKESPNHFYLRMRTSQIQGQCDWRLLKENPHHVAINNSFTFIIENVFFWVSVDFFESWNLDSLTISLSGISIHGLDKSCPKMLDSDFIKMKLGDFVQSAVKNSLIGFFNQHFPKLATTTMSTITDTSFEKMRPLH